VVRGNNIICNITQKNPCIRAGIPTTAMNPILINPRLYRPNFLILLISLTLSLITLLIYEKKLRIPNNMPFFFIYFHFCIYTPTHNHPKDTAFSLHYQINHMTICPMSWNYGFYGVFPLLLRIRQKHDKVS